MFITVTLYKKLYFFSLKVLKARKKAGNNFILLCESRNMVGQFKKAYLDRPIKILHFLTTPSRSLNKGFPYMLFLFVIQFHDQSYTAFWLDVRLSKWLLHVSNLFLLSTPVDRVLLTASWVSRRNDVKQLSINTSKLTVGVKHSTSRRTFFLIPIQQRKQPVFLSLHLDMV